MFIALMVMGMPMASFVKPHPNVVYRITATAEEKVSFSAQKSDLFLADC